MNTIQHDHEGYIHLMNIARLESNQKWVEGDDFVSNK